ncbi:methylated-DNA--[protein]-cysteine S-methyltransferase [Lactonifactor longoviformis]|uniref:methylated-DNA--[protein]-cysteine S-methyltransferase n=1 Tax=Lactonifactor longoviformis TaxID=341220 RepID=UPI001D00CE17|nr:methylated-DNA--[protein]-cysteine S-methyltransferase [Lactonifactor longoviformis]MCB5711649.1 methylated-DNA--[protein]-cysteine S-methyltransferase [Lactonifactor longoviformis]MCB5715616.1 methylated-DNA--[protein]-cysteine S-methyltransferase [Lactonifactor longoviformis]
MYYSTNYDSPLGQITLASDGEHLVGVWIEGQKYFCGSVKEELLPKDDLPEFEAAINWLNRYFAGEKPQINELPLAPIGGEFRQEVWKLLCEIPYGEVTTYGEIARKAAEKLGNQKMSAQAVGGAVGHNPISIIIPCHRVVGANGSLTGYGGGIQKKVWLLSHEGADMKKFTIPTQGTAL